MNDNRARKGPTGLAVVTPEHEGCNCHALIICTPKCGQLQGRFLAWLLNSGYGQQFLQLVKTGALHPHLNCGNVKFLGVLIPPIDEQEEIAEFIDLECGRLATLFSKVASSINKLEEYRSALITAGVTGKLRLEDAPRLACVAGA